MTTMTETEIDALTEIFNVGAGRAALSLSEIVGDEVRLSVPSLEVLRSPEVDGRVLALSKARFASVSQVFDGPFDAEAVLLFAENQALEIVRDMMGSQISLDDLADFEQEAMSELGNIILNACLSAMADMLGVAFNSSLPEYAVSSPQEVSKRLAASKDTEAYVLILNIDLLIEKHHTSGHLLFLLSSTSLTSLVTHIQRFLNTLA
jgi:chemotaxis protein CheC